MPPEQRYAGAASSLRQRKIAARRRDWRLARAGMIEEPRNPPRTWRIAPGPIFEETREANAYHPHILVPIRRIGQPREIADAVLVLASDDAGHIAGTTLNVAGGCWLREAVCACRGVSGHEYSAAKGAAHADRQARGW